MAPSRKAKGGVPDQFPVGLRVLMVDDDLTCLKILEQMLRRCMYSVTSCSQATVALNLLRERKGCFDVVLSDVHMPDMDGFKLLELVGLEMDLPVIMMSADGQTSAVMEGIRHGACDYLIKPIREEELKNLWQHVVRKKWIANKEHDQSCSLDDIERLKKESEDTENASSFISEGAEVLPKTHRRRRDEKEEDCDTENDDPSAAKRPRVVWSVELHQQFVSAVNHLGIDKAVPKRILELMSVPGLTRENVASHLQKFRLYLKRLNGVSQHQGGISSSFYGTIEQNVKLDSFSEFDIQALAASGQIPPPMLAALHAELLGRSTSNLSLTGMDQPLPGSLQGSKPILVDRVSSYGQPLIRCPSNISTHFPQNILPAENAHSGLGSWISGGLAALGPSNSGAFVDQNGNFFMGMLHNQHQQQQQKHPTAPESNRSISVQPSCLVGPSQSSPSSHAVTGPASVSQSFSFNRTSRIDYDIVSSQPCGSSFGVGQLINGGFKTRSAVKGLSVPESITPSVSSCSMNPVRWTDTARQGVLPAFPFIIGNVQETISTRVEQVFQQQGSPRSFGFVGKGTSIPSRFAVDEPELHVNNLNNVQGYMDRNGRRFKQEPNVNFVETEKVGITVSQNCSTDDLMSVISE